jgi:hypothetical integral membrane protein (TIGR02206 family)
VAGSPSHLTTLTLGAVFLLITLLSHRRDAESTLSKSTRGIIIFACLTATSHTAASRYFTGETQSLDGLIPLHLCDLIAFVAAFALLSRKPLVCELTYFLGLGGTLQGLITPNARYDFPHPTFFAFFQLHFFVVAAALLLAIGLKWKPRRPLRKTIARMFLFIVGYLGVITVVNITLGTNFAFTIEKPENPSLFDHLGPHPWYLASVLGLSFAMLLILSTPFAIRRAAK